MRTRRRPLADPERGVTSTTASQGGASTDVARHRIVRLARAHPVSSFFMAAYALSWSYWLVVLGLLGHTSPLAYWPGGYGPMLAGLVVSGTLGGRAGIRGYLRRIVSWRVKVRWYVVALVGPPALILIGMLPASSSPTGGGPSVAITPWLVLMVLANFAFMVVVGPGFGEEPGWRGFALPRMQERLGPVGGTSLLGLLWAGWHLPLTVLAGFSGGVSAFPWYAAYAIGWSLLLTWLFNHTSGSVLLAALAHVSLDESQSWTEYLLPQVKTDGAFLVVLLVAAVVTVATRGRLGYRHEPR